MFELPKYVTNMLDTLHDAGYEAYVVGGAVRDILLGNSPDDFDITTSCPPVKITELFEKTVETGIKHGTVTVLDGKNAVEITTFRQDAGYSDYRKPDGVNFISNLNEDLKRRDFTVNAMAFSNETGLIDNFGGQNDLKNRIIKAVGNPDKRFNEDALRILRAFRFSAKLDFSIDKETFSSAINSSHLLSKISRERIFSELSKTLVSIAPQKIEPLINCGALSFLGITSAKDLVVLSRLPNRLDIRFFAFCLLTKTNIQNLCKELKTDKALYKYCEAIKTLSESNFPTDRIRIKKALSISNEALLKDYLKIKEITDNISVSSTVSLLNDIINKGEPYLIRHLAVSGDDILALGYKDTDVGKALNKLLEIVISDPSKNVKKTLINIANDFLRSQCTL